jgi:hypothetical protein
VRETRTYIDSRYMSRSSGSLISVIAGQLIHCAAQGDRQIYSQSQIKQYSLYTLLRKSSSDVNPVLGLSHRVAVGDVADVSEVHAVI